MRDTSVTQWIQGLRGGDEEAASRIWARFFHRVQALAHKRLGDAPRGGTDAEDVALSAMHALCVGARQERFAQLEDREDLWGILAMITVRKAIDARRRASRAIAGALGGLELADVADLAPLLGLGDDECLDALCVTSRELLDGLEPKLREVALLRLEGYSNAEIAIRIERARPTVERHLRMIRHAWTE